MKWVDQSPCDDWPVAPADADADPARSTPRVVVPAGVHQQALAHLRAMAVEQGGLLIGVPYRGQRDAPGLPPVLVRLLACVPGVSSDASRFSLTLQASVWSAARDRLEALVADEPGSRIIGWYHSHPGFGAFFSDVDRRTQAAFFREPCSVGWVIDPADDSHAVFIGAGCLPAQLWIDGTAG